MAKPLSDNDLLAIIEQEEANSLSTTTGKLAEQRRQAMQYYYGEPYGNEIEGRSQVVTTEVKDAVEAILPMLMSIFTSAEEVVRFEAQNQEDEQAAQQATDYINYVFSRQNDGFFALYCLFKDALLLKNGFLKVYWENYEDQRRETYEGLNDDEFAMLVNDPELTLVEHTARPDEVAAQLMAQQVLAMAAAGAPVPQSSPAPMLHDAVFRRSRTVGRVCIDPVPPEEVLISRETTNDLNDARFVEHRTLRSISQLREMGFDVADDIADYAPNADFNMERFERNRFDDAWSFQPDRGNQDPSTRRVWLCLCYMNVDSDGDGIAEFRRIIKVGRNVLENVEFDSHELIGGTAMPMPHKYYGLSIHDLVGDLQLIKSSLTRNLLDNVYIANNGRYEALDGMVNMDDLLTNRPGGVVRVKALGAVKRIDAPVLGQPAYALLEYLDRVKQNRIGVTDFPNAVDPDAINAKAAFVDAYRQAAQERVQLMARILAEGPVKQLFWKILELESKHNTRPQQAKLRGEWVQVDPREWYNKFNMTVTVGLGTGSQQTILNGAMGIMNIQAGMAKAGLMGQTVTPENVWYAARCYAKAVFPKDADHFFTDPRTLPPPPQQPNVDLLKVQLSAHKAEMQDAQKRDKSATDAALQKLSMQVDVAKTQFEAMSKRSEQDRAHQAEIVQMMLANQQENRAHVADALAQIAVAKVEGANDKQQAVLQGIVDTLRATQDHNHAVMQEVVRARLAPKSKDKKE